MTHDYIQPGQTWADTLPTKGWTVATHGSWIERTLVIVRPTGVRAGDWIGRDYEGVEWTLRREHFENGRYEEASVN